MSEREHVLIFLSPNYPLAAIRRRKGGKEVIEIRSYRAVTVYSEHDTVKKVRLHIDDRVEEFDAANYARVIVSFMDLGNMVMPSG